MIRFKTIRYKNLLSSGNSFTEIPLDQAHTTLIVGENGSGKSTVIEALCFALYNRPFRNINKPQLVNSINQKNAVVEIEFQIGRNEYVVKRGIRPSFFEIYCNDVLIDQEAATRDYQKYLEDSILKMNYKTFTQIVILGTASFKPFMQLPVGQRREIIEDILDILIFTAMNQILKDKLSDVKDELVRLDAEIRLAANTAKLQENYIKKLKEDRQERVQEIDLKINAAKELIRDAELKIGTTELEITGLKELVKDSKELTKEKIGLQTTITTIQNELKNLEKEVKFYRKNDSCPICKQSIDLSFKESVILEKDSKIQGLMVAEQNHDSTLQNINERLKEIIEVKDQIAELSDEIVRLNQTIVTEERHISSLITEKQDLQTNIGNLELEKEKLREFAKKVVKLSKTKAKLQEDKHYYETASVLLKDTGIKTRIIRQYLPVINKLVNKYLAAMDFFVQFNLDEQFNESIKSRHRDEFVYESFSEGEKQRIDLSLLFTWRTIAKMKNSASCNLLFLDEVFDSSLDGSGTDYVMNLLNTLDTDTNVFVISHKGDQLSDKFSNIIRFKKSQNFSVMETTN